VNRDYISRFSYCNSYTIWGLGGWCETGDISNIHCIGFSEQIDEKRADEMGISAFVMKPIVMSQMTNTIRDVLDKK